MNPSKEQQKDNRDLRFVIQSYLEESVKTLINHPNPTDPCRNQKARNLYRLLGIKGWLGNKEDDSLGISKLSKIQEEILNQELTDFGLSDNLFRFIPLLQRSISQQANNHALNSFLHPILRGESTISCYMSNAFNGNNELEEGLSLSQEGDDYVLNGMARFYGIDADPEYLWIIANAPTCNAESNELVNLLFPSNLEGISIDRNQRNSLDTIFNVNFDHAVIPPICMFAMGFEPEISIDTISLIHQGHRTLRKLQHSYERLLSSASAIKRDNKKIIEQSEYQQHLIEALMAVDLYRILLNRNSSFYEQNKPFTYEWEQLHLCELRAYLEIHSVANEVLGFYALLSPDEPWAVDGLPNYEENYLALRATSSSGSPAGVHDRLAFLIGLNEKDTRPRFSMPNVTFGYPGVLSITKPNDPAISLGISEELNRY